MHYTIINPDDRSSEPKPRRSAKSALAAVRDLRRQGQFNVTILDYENNEITFEELSSRVEAD